MVLFGEELPIAEKLAFLSCVSDQMISGSNPIKIDLLDG